MGLIIVLFRTSECAIALSSDRKSTQNQDQERHQTKEQESIGQE